MSRILLLLVLSVVSTGIIWKGSSLLEGSAAQLSKYYGLPVAVHGGIVVAIGSSFPEISSVVISTLIHDEFALGLGAIVGSAVFNILVIPAASGFVSEELEATRDIVYKDAQFYIISILVLFMTFSIGTTYVTGGTNRAAVLTPALVLFPLGTYAVYVFLQYLDTRDHVAPPPGNVNVRRQLVTLLVALALITIGVEGIVRAALGFEAIFDTPSILWGLTVIAVGTSLPDAFVSIRAAQRDADVTSLTNVLGSNTFNLLVAVPVGVILAGSATIDYLVAIPTMGFLVFATIVFVVFTRTSLELSDRESVTLIGLYIVFLVWMALESMGVIETVRGI